MAWSSEKNKDKIPYTTDEQGNYIDHAAGNDRGNRNEDAFEDMIEKRVSQPATEH